MSALRLAGILVVLSLVLIVYLGSLLEKQPEWQTIVFAVLGAVLQAAFLGLVYEVWLRGEVEDATIEKVGISKDVRDHGLLRLDDEARVNWTRLLEGARSLNILTSNPEALIGHNRDLLMRFARENSLRELRIAIPSADLARTRSWIDTFRAEWAESAKDASFFAVEAPPGPGYDLIATDSHSVILLKAFTAGEGVERFKLLEFRKRSRYGIGTWLSDQSKQITKFQTVTGYSPGLIPEPTKAVEEPPKEDGESFT